MTDTEEFPAAWWPRPAIRMSRDFGELAKALAAAQSEMKHPTKGSVNPQFKSKYADLSSVIDAVKVLNAHEIAVIGSTDDGGDTVRVLVLFAHSSGQWQEGALVVPLAATSAQGLGSALTYGRRYLLSLMCNVASEEDDDGNAASTRSAPPRREQAPEAPLSLDDRPLSAGNVASVRAEAARLNASDADIEGWVVAATRGRTVKLPLVYAKEIDALRAARDEWKGRQVIQPTLEDA